MMSERALVEAIFDVVLKGTDADIEARQNAVWSACQTLIADCLRGADEFTRERLLQRLVPELRESVDHLSELLTPLALSQDPGETLRCPVDPSIDLPNPAPGTNGPPVKAKRRNSRAVKFPIQLRINITPRMNDSLQRISRRLLLAEGVIGRIALMQYLAQQDPQYREE